MYTVSGEEVIPEADIPSRWSWLVTVKIGVVEECQVETSGSYQMSYSMFGIASIAIMGAAYAIRKKRDADGCDDESKDRYFEMRDAAVV